MPFPVADLEGDRAGIHWLLRLRWVAVLGVSCVILAAEPILNLSLHPLPLFALVGLLCGWNVLLMWRDRRGKSVPAAGRQVLGDLSILGALLYFSGGLRNPFSVFLVVQVMVAGVLLQRAAALRAGVVGLAIILTLAVLEAREAIPESQRIQDHLSGPIGIWGVGLAVFITALVALNFTLGLMSDLRARGREVIRYHEQAERERRRVFDVVQSIGAAMVILDAELRLVWQNRRAEDTLGPMEVGSFLHLNEAASWPPRKDLEAGRVSEHEWTAAAVLGSARVYHVTASPLRSESGSLEQVVCVFTDITDRRAAERQLHRTDKLAAIGRLAAGVAHEINTPLASVRILSSEAENTLRAGEIRTDQERRELAEHLADIRQESDRIAFLVRRLLELSHPGEARTEDLDVDKVVSDAVRLISLRSSRASSRIQIETGSPLPKVRASHDRLRQVLLNVLDNALDAIKDNDGRVQVRTKAVGNQVQIEVVDDGEGIPEAHLQRVFEPFFTTKEVGEGTGLGLYVSWEIMKNLGGDMGIESRRGAGTVVRMSLPLSSLESKLDARP